MRETAVKMNSKPATARTPGMCKLLGFTSRGLGFRVRVLIQFFILLFFRMRVYGQLK